MSKIHICREHNLDHAECRAVAEGLMGQLVERFGGSMKEDNNGFKYNHPTGVKATVETSENDLTVHVKLGLMTRSLAPTLNTEINRALDKHLT